MGLQFCLVWIHQILRAVELSTCYFKFKSPLSTEHYCNADNAVCTVKSVSLFTKPPLTGVIMTLRVWKRALPNVVWVFGVKARPNGCNIVQHCWIQHVARCWMMLNEVWFPSNIVFNIVQHFFSFQVWTAMLHSFKLATCSTFFIGFGQTNMAWVCFLRVLSRFWSQTLESKSQLHQPMLHSFGHLVQHCAKSSNNVGQYSALSKILQNCMLVINASASTSTTVNAHFLWILARQFVYLNFWNVKTSWMR